MNLSGILVVAAPERFDEVVAALPEFPGVEVHQADARSGRIVVVLEGTAVEDEVAGLRRIQALPGVASAELVCQWFEEDRALAARGASAGGEG